MMDPVTLGMAKADAAKKYATAAQTFYRDIPLKPVPTVMASPPTATWGVANGATAITPALSISRTDPALTYSGGNVINTDWGYHTNIPTNSIIDVGEGFDVDFTHYGQKIEPVIVATSRGIKVDVFVEGEKITAAPTSPATSSGSYPYSIDFGSAACRRIRLRIYAGGLLSIRIEASGTIWKTTRGKVTRMIAVGDSYTAPGYLWQERAWYRRVAERLGIDEVWPMAQSGTGYLQDFAGDSGRTTFGNRVLNEVIPRAPHMVIFFGGINDSGVAGYDTGGLDTACRAAWASVKAALPNCKVFVVGAQAPSATPPAGYVTAGNIIRTAAQAQLGKTIDAYLDPTGWITGSGKAGSPTGTGNADVFTAADGIHPTTAGNQYLGERIAQGLAAYYANLASTAGVRL